MTKWHLLAFSAFCFALTPAQGALILHYKLDQNSGVTAIDSATNPANGTLSGTGSSWTNAVPAEFVGGNAYRNDGSAGAQISAGNVAKLDDLQTLTITGWINAHDFNPTAGGQDRILSNRGDATSGYFDVAFYDVAGEAGIRFEMKANGTSAMVALNSGAIDFESGWIFFAITREASGATTIYTGSPSAGLQSVGAGNVGGTALIDGSAGIFTVGNIQLNPARSPQADYSDLRIYDNSMSMEEINAVRLENLQAIPEPSSMAALAIGVGVLAARRLRKNRTV